MPCQFRKRDLSIPRGALHNAGYLAENPGFARPPAYWMYEAYGYTNYRAYAASGAETAAVIERLVRRHVSRNSPAVAQWGCGLARIFAPLQSATGWKVVGFDYNPASIAWC